MKSEDVEPFIGKRVVVRFESGMQDWGVLLHWDGAEVTDRRLFLDRPQEAFGVFQSPVPFRPGNIAEGGIAPFAT